MKKNQNLKSVDRMNFFYSIGAVIILIGVIAKFLEWKYQDALLLAGLSVEALVFTFSSIQQKTTTVVYKWENIFPELISDENANTISNTQDRYNFLMGKYIDFLEKSITSFEEMNLNTQTNNINFQDTIKQLTYQYENSANSIKELNNSLSFAITSINAFPVFDKELTNLISSLKEINENTSNTKEPLKEINDQLEQFKITLSNFTKLGDGILGQFRNLDRK
jgi:gliding motility-associated protein GldL